jgi:hypothetical protein
MTFFRATPSIALLSVSLTAIGASPNPKPLRLEHSLVSRTQSAPVHSVAHAAPHADGQEFRTARIWKSLGSACGGKRDP